MNGDVRSMNPYNKSLDFAEIDMSEIKEQSDSLQEMTIPERRDRPVQGASLSVQELTRERRFVKQAKEWAEREGEPSLYVPFMSYWPTFEQMNEEQQGWFFYWRSEMRQGRHPFTDLSYIFVYLYELIHGVGWKEPEQGYELLIELWDAYQSMFPKMNSYMVDWICDFVLVHKLNLPLMDIVMRSSSAKSGELFDLELKRTLENEPSELSLEQILTLSDYDLQRSKFYMSGGRALMEAYVPKVVVLVDSYLRKTTGKNLVDTFYKGNGKTIERYLFRSAVYDTELYGRTLPLRIYQLRKCPPLRYYMTQLIRCTENKLRELHHFKGRLRGISLMKETWILIERFLEKEYTEATKPAGPVISIDPERLATLQKDSEEVRSMLTVEDELIVEEIQQEWIPAIESMADGVKEIEPRAERWGNDSLEVGPSAEISPQSMELSLNSVTDVSLLQTDLIVQQAELAQGDDTNQVDLNPNIVWDTSSLDEDWLLFTEQLGQAHLEALYALKEASDSVNDIAEKYGMMPALLLDEINELAMETIGDLVVDGESIAVDYIDHFALLGRNGRGGVE
ncbi:TerB N-terminal domain-containing protein [Paenibacillus sp. D2_2]|uniref:TerB N-terminal domain-containing protein n=1 Tax=Paenibacillus sp. D2_2 TaxID=3073092 RepID=UPI0028158F0A|nr:TerB N-terminal domain-containing protein [Paenibacillus sp. D2_2]WMT38872.1 TerB N-terminal domain-containing protein [Paenibacillus sp. D2_2]